MERALRELRHADVRPRYESPVSRREQADCVAGSALLYLAQVGFPGWKDQVHKSALKRVREATRLTNKDGCDGKVLFEHAEPLTPLISEYAEPLKRLAKK
jgi:hypothetical protein